MQPARDHQQPAFVKESSLAITMMRGRRARKLGQPEREARKARLIELRGQQAPGPGGSPAGGPPRSPGQPERSERPG